MRRAEGVLEQQGHIIFEFYGYFSAANYPKLAAHNCEKREGASYVCRRQLIDHLS